MLAPFGRDADLACKMLSDVGLQCRFCRDMDELHVLQLEDYGALLLTEEVLSENAVLVLSALLDAQPSWSNLPIVVFLGRNKQGRASNGQGPADAIGRGRGMVLLERPTRVATFISVMRSAVLARRRQFELRDELNARQKAEAHAQMLTAEMKHRIKNSLTIVGALASRTFRSHRPIEESLETFSARLRSMASAQDVLTQSNYDGADLRQLVSQALEPYRQDDRPDRISIDGPNVWISGRQTTPLMMAMHELATNAVKYGSLSVGSGRVVVCWRIEGVPAPQVVLIEWNERGGPPVKPPERRGFGSGLVERGLATELGGHATISFAPAGVVCQIRFAPEVTN